MSDKINWNEIAASFQRRLRSSCLKRLALELGVDADALVALDVGWSDKDSSWTFPEKDQAGTVIGILKRFENGKKKLMKDGARGLYLPQGWKKKEGTIYVPEGASDVAAFLSVGLRSVGRPACQGGLKYLIELFKNVDDDILIVGENDKKEDGKWPGRDGARALASQLARETDGHVRWTLPPEDFKDIRSMLNDGGASAK